MARLAAVRDGDLRSTLLKKTGDRMSCGEGAEGVPEVRRWLAESRPGSTGLDDRHAAGSGPSRGVELLDDGDRRAPEGDLLARRLDHGHLAVVASRRQALERDAQADRHGLGARVQA